VERPAGPRLRDRLRRAAEAPGRVWPRALLHLVLGALLAGTLAPMVWLVAASFKSSQDLFHYTFFPPPGRLSTENFERLFGTYRLMPGEVRDWSALAGRIADAGRAAAPTPGRRIWALLDEAGRARLARAAAAHGLAPEEEDALRAALNRVLARRDLYDGASFAQVAAGEDALRAALNRVLARRDLYDGASFAQVAAGEDARRLLARPREALRPEDVERLNRALLEAAYPQLVGRGLAGLPFTRYLMNSLFITSAVVLVQVFFSSLGGFALAKYEFRGKRAIMAVMLLTMMVPAQVLLAPLYELIYTFGLMDRHLGLIVPAAVSVFGMFLFRQAMLAVPDELLEAARLDGCSEFGLYWRIALPVSRPMVGAFCLIAFMGTWNAFLWPQIILHTRERFTLTVGLTQLVGTYTEQYGVMLAGTLLAILPAMALFFILQREFISGLTAGAVKG
jgi:ABC-type glycerol-3-phosphate transport system permease component